MLFILYLITYSVNKRTLLSHIHLTTLVDLVIIFFPDYNKYELDRPVLPINGW